MSDTRNRILDVALEVLGENPEAGMGEIAAAAGVVRRTVYGHFPTRAELVATLTERAVTEMTTVLTEVTNAGGEADATWADFIASLWPLVRRYRALLSLRRGVHGEQIHALLGPLDDGLADLVQRGQESGAFARHLPAATLSQVSYAAVFSIADAELAEGNLDPAAAIITSLLILGVPEKRARALI